MAPKSPTLGAPRGTRGAPRCCHEESAMPRMTGNRYFAEAVHAYGTTHVFFVPTIMLPAMAEMEDIGIRRVVTHGEKAAAYMADGYARASRRPGLCLAQTIVSATPQARRKRVLLGCSTGNVLAARA